MSDQFIAKQATRSGVVPLISLYSESGCGKSYSGLLLARGIAGPDGLLVGVDTESRRMSLYADVIPGGFKVIDFDHPFSPARYIAALSAAFDMKPAVVFCESMSHEWEGIGGVCDMAAANEEKSGKQGLHNWKTPKFEHQKFVQFLLRSPVPLVCSIRAKYKTRQKKGTKEMAESGEIMPHQVGKTIIIKDSVTSPIQSEDFVYESTFHAEILQNHNIIVTKASHPMLRKCFPDDNSTPITIEHGKLVAQWCSNPTGAKTEQPKSTTPKVATEATRTWMISKLTERGLKDAAINYGIDKAFIMPDEGLDKWPLSKTPTTTAALEELISQINK
jgi:hypothetical protein